MILRLSARYSKEIAFLLLGIFYTQFLLAGHLMVVHGGMGLPVVKIAPVGAMFATPEEDGPENPGKVKGKAAAKRMMMPLGVKKAQEKKGVLSPNLGGPTQPEMQSFTPVSANNMVDMFSGDFSYNIPLLDVGGYPVNIGYHSGIGMDDDASWVGLGWNINPGTITRNMRGLPDDFNGGEDTMRKVNHIKDNNTIGVNIGDEFEIVGLPSPLGLNAGVFHNTYSGWGAEASVNASLEAGNKSTGFLSGGLSISDNSQNGLTISPSLGYRVEWQAAHDHSNGIGVQLSSSYNSRSGIKDLQLGLTDKINKYRGSLGGNAQISFAGLTYLPTIKVPTTNFNYTVTLKVGGEVNAWHPELFISGYYTKEYIAAADTALSVPAYGYLNYQNFNNNWGALTDFNREKDISYRDKPTVPNIGVPFYTYDVFSISGEGTGGMFRPYRGDIGFIADPQTRSKTTSGAASLDLGAGNILHGGVDLNGNYSVTETGAWLSENNLRNTIAFRSDNGLFQGHYFRNPSEKAINTTAFYDAIGGDDVVHAGLFQSGSSILATNKLIRTNGKKNVGTTTLTSASVVKNTRDKREQVISYLTAEEASQVGLNKYIEHYAVNVFQPKECDQPMEDDAPGDGVGVNGSYYPNPSLSGSPFMVRLDTMANFYWAYKAPLLNFPSDNFSVRWLGRLRAPVTGTYYFSSERDDAVRFFMQDSTVLNEWKYVPQGVDSLNLVAGKLYNIKIDYREDYGKAFFGIRWKIPGGIPLSAGWSDDDNIAKEYLYPMPTKDTFQMDTRTKEYRVNSFRKANHISEIDVLNADGRRYVYGIPVYNLKQKEVSFAADAGRGNLSTGLVGYTDQQDNTVKNNNGKDGYFSKEEMPAYAHSFLLTGILSSDYVDVTSDGISDDDLGDAVKFNYSKTAGIANPFEWKAPYVKDSANYSEGFKSYNRDDKAHYVSGTKELWYLHSIESKTMIATFTVQQRKDMLELGETGDKTNNGKAMCLKQIDLYSKADFLAHGSSATPIKTVHFEYTYELCRGLYKTSGHPLNDSGKLTLKKVWFTYNNNSKGQQNPYVFYYHSNNPRYKSNSTDKWGTYKDASQNPGYKTTNVITNSDYPYALQDSAAAAYNVGAWMMDSIGLPSGGRIKVNYESDDYAYVQNRRATVMCKVAGFGYQEGGTYSSYLYGTSPLQNDNLYIYIKVPYTSVSKRDLYARYLAGIDTFYFKLNVRMPTDDFGGGYDYVPCFAEPDLGAANWYGIKDDHTIWIKVKGVNKAGDGDGDYSPLAQTAINALRLNLPSKAYPGSELEEDINFMDAVKILSTMVTNITGLLSGFTSTARSHPWARQVDTSRTLVRLDCPTLKKYGGGLRVKSVFIYDNWNAMTGKKESLYGQVYDYTTTEVVNSQKTTVSSGVATWETGAGADENPFHLPIEYTEKLSVLAPAAMQYAEAPLGENFYPSPSIGYSKVRVRSIHTNNTRSANGYSESTFYTTRDFPTSWDYSMLDNDSKKRFKPLLGNFLRINARNFLTVSQGFKVELNDMNGRPHTEATYPENDSNYISYTENIYHVDNLRSEVKHLSNVVTTIDPLGNVDTAATIGKDAELMVDLREQNSTTTGANINLNSDMFGVGPFPIIIPTIINLYQHETRQYRSVAMMKVIQRYGILDSVIHIEKGSMVSTKNVAYDSETGEPLLTRTQNEFNDPVYEFNYPSHWAYNTAGPAYRNIDAVLSHLTIKGGKITAGLPAPDSTYLTAGDELLVYSKQTIGTACGTLYASFPDAYKLWVIDTALLLNGPQRLYLVDQNGTPFSGNDVSLKVTRSGRRNMGGAVGSIASLANPIRKNAAGQYQLVFDTSTLVLNASANELKQFWKVGDKRKTDITTACVNLPQPSADAVCSCLRPFFDSLISRHLLFVPIKHPRLISELAASVNIDVNSCSILMDNKDKYFYSYSVNSYTSLYQAHLGNLVINLHTVSGYATNLYNLVSQRCDSGKVIYKDPTIVVPPYDTTTISLVPNFTANLFSEMKSCPYTLDTLLRVDSVSDHLMVENNLNIDGYDRNALSVLRFKQLDGLIPLGSSLIWAKLILQADQRGHASPQWPNANSVNLADSLGISLTGPQGWFPRLSLDSLLSQAYQSPWFGTVSRNTPFQSDTVDMTSYVNQYVKTDSISNTLVLTQGAAGLQSGSTGSFLETPNGLPPYLLSGYTNYYSTYYSQRYADSTKWPVLKVSYQNPHPYVDTFGAVLEINNVVACTNVVGKVCYSAVTDTVVNPYQYGILGNLRPERSYVYYNSRKETDPSEATNIRVNGVISNFAPFWTLQNNRWLPSSDTTRWVWNSRTTLFNRKGFELENADPLGRYNAGLYGYGLTLPVAVTQNSHYQEAEYEGFEDYGFVANTCDSSCAEGRFLDFSPYLANITTVQAHTGLYSLRLEMDSSLTMGFNVLAGPADQQPMQLNDSLATGACGGQQLVGIKAAANTLLPSFTPIAGKKMVLSAWVKEEGVCNCSQYTRNYILVHYAGSTTTQDVTLYASGNIIEGWERYEGVLSIPVGTTSMTMTMQAADTAVTYFDDIRLHPFSANMKSYVYNATTLRLMAELDENNYATFYEYDDDGTLVRVKKETERGIMTIKETRSALLKPTN